jgi:hypothetical protein
MMSNRDERHTLYVAVIKGDVATLASLATMQNVDTFYDAPLLFLAVSNEKVECAKILLERGANVNMDHLGTTALSVAVEMDNPECVKLLCSFGARVDNVTQLLSQAIINDKRAVVRALLDAGADISKVKCVVPSWVYEKHEKVMQKTEPIKGAISAFSSPQPSVRSAPPHKNDGERCMGIYDYKATSSDQMSIKKNDTMIVIEKKPNGWWKCKGVSGSCKGQTGDVPGNYLQILEILEQAKAKFAYKAVKDDELTFAKGDVVNVYKRGQTWWIGELNGQFGSFQISYFVETVKNDMVKEPYTSAPAQAVSDVRPTPVIPAAMVKEPQTARSIMHPAPIASTNQMIVTTVPVMEGVAPSWKGIIDKGDIVALSKLSKGALKKVLHLRIDCLRHCFEIEQKNRCYKIFNDLASFSCLGYVFLAQLDPSLRIQVLMTLLKRGLDPNVSKRIVVASLH